MEYEQEFVLVSPATVAGEQFMQLLKVKKIPFAVIVNSQADQLRYQKMGIEHVLVIDTQRQELWRIPELKIGKIYLFERSLPLCCRYIQICRTWSSQQLYVITEGNQSRLIYRGLGADYIIHTNGSSASFLL
ncbi:hypothetical protein PO903_04710 [Paenibacillus sp. PK4536]|jgi:hypothetical protein|uniref:Uncharacterized protein n=1 Tax=Paenibacillus nuruki TaxID=1886670 RepID=A0A1E3L7G8_9BACL|nr:MULTISPECIES: hypothetical protein [Paenibacillus]ODP29643.1 hypothetical protein PTI45_01126 [Paenibacillus nuruki]TKJ89862.1 hypothetical protein PaeCFBP13512_14690 [Paenibacillus sp. CFBP13512]WIM40197.1 hypothetical protein PO903_04710 [Paenibacillus sp. PK4536]CAJ1317458.1 Transcription-repair coupling factor [Paenibacillus nuruki]